MKIQTSHGKSYKKRNTLDSQPVMENDLKNMKVMEKHIREKTR